MNRLDMGKYSAYREMGKSCELREITDKKVIWPNIGHVDIADKSFRFRLLTRGDIDAAAELWRASYPEVYGSVHEWILFPEEYPSRFALPENWEKDATEKDHIMIVGEDLGLHCLVFATILTKWDKNLHIEMSFVAIHPDFRKGRMSVRIWSEMALMYNWLKESGAEYVTVFCETWHNITQYIWFKQMGWKVAGIFPGNYTRWAEGRLEYRACTVHFYRFINNGERHATMPKEWQLLPEILELWNCLEKINQLSSEDGLEGSS
ncbi:MAG: hypothetical protein ACOZF0_03905 [Thermodesulfobacteriota bacterium]